MSRYAKNTNRIAAAIVAATPFTSGAYAATAVWTGSAGDLNWNTPANWNGGILPTDIAQIQENGYNSGDTLVTGVDQIVNRLAFNFSSTNAASKDLTLSGNTITLTGATSTNVGLNRQNTVSGVQTIDSNLLLGGSQQWNVNGNSSAASGVGKLVVNGVIGETAGGSKDLVKNGNTNLELNGDNTFTGQTTIIQNTIVVGHANALGLGTSPIVVGNTVVNTSQSNLLTKSGVTFTRHVLVRSGQTGGSRLGGADGLGLSTWTGNVALNKDVILTGGLGVPTGTVDFKGNFVDGSDPNNPFVSSGVTKQNGGVVKLSGPANSYSGPTTINAGTLMVNGLLTESDAAVTATNTARLGGLGTIDRPVNIGPGAVLSPGDAGTGTLTIGTGKTLSLADGAVLEWEPGATATNSDLVNAAAVSFGGSAVLKILAGANPPDASATYVLLNWTGDDPASLASWTIDPSSGFGGSIAYVGASDGVLGGQLVLTGLAASDVPEPMLGLPLAGIALLLRSRRRAWPSM